MAGSQNIAFFSNRLQGREDATIQIWLMVRLAPSLRKGHDSHTPASKPKFQVHFLLVENYNLLHAVGFLFLYFWFPSPHLLCLSIFKEEFQIYRKIEKILQSFSFPIYPILFPLLLTPLCQQDTFVTINEPIWIHYCYELNGLPKIHMLKS